VVGYILGMCVLMGGALALLLALSARSLGNWQRQRFYHLSQALIPIADCSVFLGLSAMTVTLLRNEGVPVFWANDLRLVLLAGANLWSLWLAHRIFHYYEAPASRQLPGLLLFGVALALVDYAWALMFWIW